jgi:3-hydroxy-D-aspartate aldolase
MTLEDVDTPALLVDLDAFEHNLERLSNETSAMGVRLRPHAKTHKCSVIALRQIALGAVGVCCQKVSEAEALAQDGVNDILISNEVVGQPKLDRLAALAKRIAITVSVDNPDNVDALDQTARRFAARIDVLVEVDVGGDRCGLEPGEPACVLAERVACSSNLRFRGLQAYQGRAQHVRGYAERKSAIEQSRTAVWRTVELLHGRGLLCDIVAGGGTGTYQFEAATGVYNELQPGSYIFMDEDYRKNLDHSGAADGRFQQSLYVYTQVMSVRGRNFAVVDAGLKALAFDSGMPAVMDMADVSYCRPSDEHGMLDVSACPTRLRLGTKVKLAPGHCDPTVNLYDWYVAVRHGRVEALWPIVARGALL